MFSIIILFFFKRGEGHFPKFLNFLEILNYYIPWYLQGNDASEKTEGLSKEELGRLVASRWTGENTEKQTEEVDAAKDKDHGGHEEMHKATHDGEDDGYASETDDDNQRYEDEDMEDEVDEDFREEDHYDSGSYKSDSDTEPDLSGLQQFVPGEFVVCASFKIKKNKKNLFFFFFI